MGRPFGRLALCSLVLPQFANGSEVHQQTAPSPWPPQSHLQELCVGPTLLAALKGTE